MPETAIENQICDDCGTEVRSEALFCYHCGGPVTDEGRLMVSEKAPQDDIADLPSASKQPKEKVSEESAEKDFDESHPPADDVPEKKPTKEPPKKKLESAASIRNRARPMQPKQIEIIWEDHENRPNIWFIAVALFLTLAVLAILLLAIYLR